MFSDLMLSTCFRIQYYQVQKTYFAVAIGKMALEGQIDTPIDDKASSTKYKVLATETSEKFDFLNVFVFK